jgi:hypothetical protein
MANDELMTDDEAGKGRDALSHSDFDIPSSTGIRHSEF